MKTPAKADDPKRSLRLKGKKNAHPHSGYGVKRSPAASTQKVREQIEPEGEQARRKKQKGM
jgi:hypothetical protein